jgi:hypothetical protein
MPLNDTDLALLGKEGENKDACMVKMNTTEQASDFQ